MTDELAVEVESEATTEVTEEAVNQDVDVSAADNTDDRYKTIVPQDVDTPEESTDEADDQVEDPSALGTEETQSDDSTENKIPMERLQDVLNKDRQKAAQIKELEAKLTELEAVKAKPEIIDEPKLEDFDWDDNKFMEAKVQYRVDQQLKTQTQEAANIAANQAAETLYNDFVDVQKTYLNENANYKAVIESLGESFQIETETANLVVKTANPGVHHALMNDLGMLNEIENMDYESKVFAIAKLNAETVLKPIKQKTSTAPSPIKVESGKSASTHNANATSKQINGMSVAQYRAWRAKGGGK